MNNASQRPSSYRWMILAVIWVTNVIGVAPQFQLAALAYKIIPELNLTLAQFSLIFSAPMLGSIFLSIPAGALGDKFGAKKVVAFGIILAIIGDYFRFLSHGFLSYYFLMFLSGLSPAMINANIAKIIGAWFSKEQAGTAMGIFFTGGGLGMTIGLSTATLFTSLTAAYMFSGYAMLAVLILWVLLIKDKPKGAPDVAPMPVLQYLREVSRSRNIWLVGLGMMFFMGCNMVFSGNFANALNSVRGIDPQTASLMAAVVTLGGVAGSLVAPVISDRIGRIKPFLTPLAVLGAVFMYFTWNSAGTVTWILLPLLGFMTGASTPLLMSYPILLPEVGPRYAGSAGGLISTLQLFGAVVIPSFVVAPLANNNFGLLFLLACVLYLLFGAVIHFLPEVGAKARLAVAHDAGTEV